MKKRTVIMISLLAVLTLVVAFIIFYINTIRPTTELYTDPQTISGTVGQDFAIDLRISNVANLYGWQLKLRWNTTILNLVNATEGAFLKSRGGTFFDLATNETDHVVLYCTLLGDLLGVNGSGVLATVWFQAKEKGRSELHFYDTVLVNSSEETITHTVRDGRFST